MQSSLKMNRMCIGMRKLKISWLILLFSMFFTNGAVAQNKPLACQGDAGAGLLWENGRWVTKSFKTDKFILVQTNSGLTLESVAKAIESDSTQVSCKNVGHRISCGDLTGHSLIFDSRTLQGGFSQMFGSTTTGAKRDTVTVEVFSCTPF